MKLKVDLDGQEFTLDLQPGNDTAEYVLTGAASASGRASVVRTLPGVFSVLIESKSYSVATSRRAFDVEVWAGGRRHIVALADPRDRSTNASRVAAAGPIEIRAQMPGKVVSLLVDEGYHVKAGQGVIIVEAMKMQNEMKSPKEGTVQKIYVSENGTVVAGETLMVIE